MDKIISSYEKKVKSDEASQEPVLFCERPSVYSLLTFCSGFYGGYTFSVRGGVFCNAQTANFVLMAYAFGTGEWKNGLYYLVPLTAYLFGAFISEILPNYVKKLHFRWETLEMFFETLVIIIVGLIPDSLPVQIAQVSINLICSMRYNTYRNTAGISMATTFCTNHVRQIGLSIANAIMHPEDKYIRRKLLTHLLMILCFFSGALSSVIISNYLTGKTILITVPILIYLSIRMLICDITSEKDLLSRIPEGH